MTRSKRVVITGGSGFVGANLVRKLLYNHHAVHLLVRKNFSDWRIQEIRKHIRLHLVNIGDKNQVETAMKKIKPDWVFHLAAYGAYSWQTDLEEMIKTNIQGTAALLGASAKADSEVFINTGSSSEYGYYSEATRETDLLKPNSWYAVTKAAATHLCQLATAKKEIYAPTLRLYSAYGPYEEPKRLMPTLITYARRGKLPKLANPKIARDFVYVDDVCEAYIKTVNKKPKKDWGPIYNVGSSTQTRLGDLVRKVKILWKINQSPTWSGEVRPWDTTYWRANNSKIRRELGWAPRYSLRQGLQKMNQWLADNPAWEDYYRKSYEI